MEVLKKVKNKLEPTNFDETCIDNNILNRNTVHDFMTKQVNLLTTQADLQP